MDYVAWTHRVSQFLRSLTFLPGDVEVHDTIEPIATHRFAQSTRAWLNAEECSLPAELRAFLGEASPRCIFQYRWTPERLPSTLTAIYPGRSHIEGGGDFCQQAKYFLYDRRLKAQSKSDSILAGDDAERAANRIELLPLESGDCISLNSEENGKGEVVHVRTKTGDCRTISRSFDGFLEAWEKMAYIAPTWENLTPWLDQSTGLLSLDCVGVGDLRDVLTGASSAERSKL